MAREQGDLHGLCLAQCVYLTGRRRRANMGTQVFLARLRLFRQDCTGLESAMRKETCPGFGLVFASGCGLAALLATGAPRAARAATAVDPERDAAETGAPATSPIAVPLTPSWFGPGRAARTAYAGVEGGWDGARQSPIFETNVEAPLVGPLSFRAGFALSSADGRGADAGRASPSFLLKLDVLNQATHGISAAVFGGYRAQGFNLVPAVEVGLALSHRTESTLWLSSVAYGQGLQEGERYGDARVAGLLHVRRGIHVGLDARARVDLEWAQSEPAGEAGFDGVAGPIAVWELGRFVLSGQAGMAALASRAGGPTHLGSTARLGIGAGF